MKIIVNKKNTCSNMIVGQKGGLIYALSVCCESYLTSTRRYGSTWDIDCSNCNRRLWKSVGSLNSPKRAIDIFLRTHEEISETLSQWLGIPYEEMEVHVEY